MRPFSANRRLCCRVLAGGQLHVDTRWPAGATDLEQSAMEREYVFMYQSRGGHADERSRLRLSGRIEHDDLVAFLRAGTG